jgi:hypothetical protein
MLSHFQDESVVHTLYLEGVQDGRQLALELDVHDGSNDLGDLARNYLTLLLLG